MLPDGLSTFALAKKVLTSRTSCSFNGGVPAALGLEDATSVYREISAEPMMLVEV
jgi:hypothetical protein